jgi:uncharacterized membrane protein
MSTRGGARWLLEELPRLVREAVIDEATAERLRRRYAPELERSRRGAVLLAFGILGGVLIGSGVILLVAHNWDELSRPVRAGLCFLLIFAAQLFAGWVMARRFDSEPFREGTATFSPSAVRSR